LLEDLAMPEQSPLPMMHTFLVCREITQDIVTNQCILIDPKVEFSLPHFPASVLVSIYGQLSEMRGEYSPEFRLWGSDGEILWEYLAPTPMTSPDGDPLRQYRFVFRNLAIPFPRPGRYDLLLLASGTEIARYPLRIEQVDS
jgi:hypothetical protein